MKDILGKLWASPITLIGLLFGLINLFTGAKISIRNNAICFVGCGFVSEGSAITLGNVILSQPSLNTRFLTYIQRAEGAGYGKQFTQEDYKVILGDHEEAHTYQYQKWGILFPIVWRLRDGASKNNKFETDADEYALKKSMK